MHDSWKTFLNSVNAKIENGRLTDTADISEFNENAEEFFCDLSELAILHVEGKDAVEFLHAQFSSDVAALQINQSQLSAWCNIKGRVIVSFILCREQSGFYLLLHADMRDYFLKRLQMFVLRSEVNIIDKSDELVRMAIHSKEIPDLATESTADDVCLYPGFFPDSDMKVLICSPGQASVFWTTLHEQLPFALFHHWQRENIKNGIPWIQTDNTEEFLPQSLNFDLLGALSFDKGCYPGQEIIARMHFRGKLKQRCFIIEADTGELVPVKTKLFHSDTEQHVGLVVNSYQVSTAQQFLLVTLDLEYTQDDKLRLQDMPDASLSLRELPYSISS